MCEEMLRSDLETKWSETEGQLSNDSLIEIPPFASENSPGMEYFLGYVVIKFESKYPFLGSSGSVDPKSSHG